MKSKPTHVKIFLFTLLFIPLLALSQNPSALGRDYNDVLKYHSSKGGVRIPETVKLSDTTLVLDYKCTDDQGIGKHGFMYFFKKGKCTLVTIAYLGEFDGNFRNYLNKDYQYAGNNFWVDNVNRYSIQADIKKNGFFIYYTRLR